VLFWTKNASKIDVTFDLFVPVDFTYNTFLLLLVDRHSNMPKGCEVFLHFSRTLQPKVYCTNAGALESFIFVQCQCYFSPEVMTD